MGDQSATLPMKIISSGYRTDLMLLGWSGSEITDHGDHLVIRTPRIRAIGGATSCCSAIRSEPASPGIGLIGLRSSSPTPPIWPSASTASTVRDSDADVRPLITDDDWSQAYNLRLAGDDLEATEENRLFLKRRLAADRLLVGAGHGAWFGAFVDGRLRSSAGIFSDDSGLARYQLVHRSGLPAPRPALARRPVRAAGRCRSVRPSDW